MGSGSSLKCFCRFVLTYSVVLLVDWSVRLHLAHANRYENNKTLKQCGAEISTGLTSVHFIQIVGVLYELDGFSFIF